MAKRLSRAWVIRATVAAAVFALPALGAGAAQAAIAGAPHESTTNRPDLVSATILTAVPNSVDFCFDKTLQSTSGTTGFELGGYRSANAVNSIAYALETTLAPPAGLPANSCIRATYSAAAAGDLNKYSIGTVLAGHVHTNGGPPTADANNITDSTSLTGSNTHNGTAGFTTGPDLASVVADSTSNSITYFFDQELSGAAINPATFYFVDTAGNVCEPAAVIAGGGNGDNSVTLLYGPSVCRNGANAIVAPESVSSAVRAGDVQGAVSSANDPGSFNVDNALPVTGTGNTAAPDVTDVKMEANQSALDFTFNKTVTPSTASDFFADLSNGTQVQGNNAAVIAVSTNSTTVRVTFPNFGTYDEYVIGGSVAGRNVTEDGCAVFISALTNGCNTPGSQPLDAPFGNAGAFATGFTTGPDVLGAVGNTTTNVVSMALDQRAFTGVPGDINLLDNTGNIVATAGSSSLTLPSQAAGAQVATVQFASGQVGSATNLNLVAGALTTNLATGSAPNCVGADCTNQDSVDQILAITKTSSLVKAAHHAKRVSLAKQLRVVKARRAAAAKKLAKLEKTHKHHRHHR